MIMWMHLFVEVVVSATSRAERKAFSVGDGPDGGSEFRIPRSLLVGLLQVLYCRYSNIYPPDDNIMNDERCFWSPSIIRPCD